MGNTVSACILTAVYMILTERFTLTNALVGLGLSIIALALAHVLCSKGENGDSLVLGAYYFISGGYLLFVILKSAVLSIPYIFSARTCVCRVQYKTTIHDERLKSLLANAITLSPGTATADLEDDVLDVLALCRDDATDGEAIRNEIKKMEAVFRRIGGEREL
jgi:multicomponent Na+:H+ antiporter subunit E